MANLLRAITALLLFVVYSREPVILEVSKGKRIFSPLGAIKANHTGNYVKLFTINIMEEGGMDFIR